MGAPGRECRPLRGQAECHDRGHIWMGLEGNVGVCQAEGFGKAIGQEREQHVSQSRVKGVMYLWNDVQVHGGGNIKFTKELTSVRLWRSCLVKGPGS